MATSTPKNQFSNNSLNNYSWQGVLQFLYVQSQQNSQKENMHYLEKKQLTEKLKQYEGRMTAMEAINHDLLMRNKMLEHCLRTIKQSVRMKQNQQTSNINGKSEDLQAPASLPKVPQRRPKPNKNHIAKILSSLGIKDFLNGIEQQIAEERASEERVPSNQLSSPPDLFSLIKKQQTQDMSKNTAGNKHRYVLDQQIKYAESSTVLVGHQDGVRDLCFLNNHLISVSQDSTMKVWDLQKIHENQKEAQGSSMKKEVKCVSTIRQHAGPIFSCIQIQKQSMVLTGGMQGIVRAWNFQESNEKQKSCKMSLLGSWVNSQADRLQPVWQLLHNPINNTVFTTSSQPAIKVYSLKNAIQRKSLKPSQKGKQNIQNNYLHSFLLSTGSQEDIPTAITLHNQQLAVGYVHTHSLVTFDLQTQKPVTQIQFPIFSSFPGNAQKIQQYTNFSQISTNKQGFRYFRLISHPRFIIGGYQDKKIRMFDINSASKGQMVLNFEAHDETVMGVSLTMNKFYFFSCAHDGFVKLWDIRKLQSTMNSKGVKVEPVIKFKSHSQKYDEAIHAIQSHTSRGITASAGADAKIKLFFANYEYN